MSAGYMRRCAGKDRHGTKAEAFDRRSSLAAKNGKPVSAYTVYRCDQCLGLHVGGTGGSFVTRSRRPGKRANKNRRGR